MNLQTEIILLKIVCSIYSRFLIAFHSDCLGLFGLGEEKKLLLLLWSAKSELFAEAVDLRATMQPIEESKTLGTRVGTRLQQKILKAIQGRQGAVNKLIAQFNKTFEEFITKFPQQRIADQSHHPLTYSAFAKMPLDHKFWNNGMYFHSEAPWAVDSDVQSGIYCMSLLDRVREEFELIVQELDRAMGWAIDFYNHMRMYIQHIQTRQFLLTLNLCGGWLIQFTDVG